MRHWTDPYIGMAYEEGSADCVALAILVERETFGRLVKMPTNKRWASVRHDPSKLADDYGIPTECPIDGDAVAMRCGASWHLGVFARISGDEWVLHSTRASAAAHLTRLRDLNKQGLRIEGFYKWK